MSAKPTILTMPTTMPAPAGNQPFPAWPCRLPLGRVRGCTIWVDDSPDSIAQGLRTGIYRLPHSFTLLRELTPRGATVLDLGAHLGTFTLAAAARGYGVLAVEAAPRNAFLLARSIAHNRYGARARLVHAAVGDHDGRVDFHAAGPHGSVIHAQSDGPTVSVRLATASTLLAEQGWTDVGFIKLDVEGSEVAALTGMGDWLANPAAPPILVEVNRHTLGHFGQTPRDLLGALADRGYACYRLAGRTLIASAPDEAPPTDCEDYLAVKQPLPRLRHWDVVAAHTTLRARPSWWRLFD